MKQYPEKSWIDPRIEVRSSPIQGKGLFAIAPIRKGETAAIFGGHLYTPADVAAGIPSEQGYVAIGENLYIGHTAAEGDSPDDFINHSCTPNLWLDNETTVVAMRDIEIGEELTADYAVLLGDTEDWPPTPCHCGAPNCRGMITDQDWRRPDLQKKFEGHFSPFINERIRKFSRS